MRYIFGEVETVEVREGQAMIVFVDFSGMTQLAVMNSNETLSTLPVMQGTVPIISL